MKVGFEDLKQYQHQVAMVDGAFDPLHQGHIEYFRQAHQLGLPVLCNIAPDQYVSRKHSPLLSAEQRAAIIDSIRYVALTHVNPFDTETVLRELRPRYYVKGKDWEGRLPQEQVKICPQYGIEIVYLDTVLGSSTQILQRYFSQAYPHTTVEAFEGFVFSQSPILASHYDDEYFTSEWREGGNRYTLEERRKIEARNPELIKTVFQAQRVLDMGCGPGALMYLLSEIGVQADGIDFSLRSRELAPPAVRDRIIIGSVTDQLVPDNAYDLIICREVFEHLTVLQLRQAVRNICRMSAKYVYVTTRFHPAPRGLLDITNQFAVDPTHITLVHKEFLRLLFVLEGFRCRPDLEAAMDWLKKDRVLVYQKQTAP
jgi:cytidyltransferase-like protein